MPTKRLVTADKALNPTLTDEIIDEVYNQHNAPLMECITGAPTLMSYKAFAREIELEVLTRLKKRLGLADGPPKPEHKVALIAHPQERDPGNRHPRTQRGGLLSSIRSANTGLKN